MYDDIIVKPVSMSSKEISGLTGKQHKNVLRDIKVLISDLFDVDGSDLSHVELPGISVNYDKRGYVSAIHLNKRHTTNLLMGYSAKLRDIVLERLEELEADALSRAEQDHLDNFWLKNRRGASSNYIHMQEEVLLAWQRDPAVLGTDVSSASDPEDSLKKYEANFINGIIIGMPSGVFKNRYKILGSRIRDGMPARLLQAYESLENSNTTLLNAGVPSAQRHKSLESGLQRAFPDVVAFREVAALEKQYCVATRASATFEYTHPSKFLELHAEPGIRAKLSSDTIKRLESDSAKKTLAQRKMELIDMIAEVAVGDDETMFDD